MEVRKVILVTYPLDSKFCLVKKKQADRLVENAVNYKTRVKIPVPIEDKLKDTIQKLERINGIKI